MHKISEIVVKNLSLSNSDKVLFRGGNFHLSRGEIVGLGGLNGSGKSSFCHALLGLIPVDSQCIFFAGVDDKEEKVLIEPNRGLLRDQIYFVFQNPDCQIVGSLIRDDVAFAGENRGVQREILKDRVKEALELVGLAGFEMRSPATLSGGQKQRLAIAGSIVAQASFLILDEPFAMLDPMGRSQLRSLLQELVKSRNLGVLIVSHNARELFLLDRNYVIHKQKLKEFSPGRSLFESSIFKELGFCEP
ncbi:MAG: energy-coupling factor ABC transporter ATP-binding protein [Candidatus Cloacimonetes bacterium]|nr:energy-coupling factor ABC transporter ATP-binding protein [Candidatus Cloacimonadota bacterium]